MVVDTAQLQHRPDESTSVLSEAKEGLLSISKHIYSLSQISYFNYISEIELFCELIE